METKKILLSAPVTDHKRYIYALWFSYIRCLSYPVDYYFVDNSKTGNFCDTVNRMGFQCDRVEQKGRRAVEFMAECSEMIRQKAIAGNYDYLFLLELDQFPPLNTIEQLLFDCRHGVNVVSGMYHIGQAWSRHFFAMKKENPGFVPIIRNYTPFELFMHAGQKLDTRACGTGCILIPRAVLEQIEFRIDPDKNTHADTFFHDDLDRLNIPVILNTSVLSYHYNQSWKTIPEHFVKSKKE